MDRKEFEHALAELSLPSVLLFEGEEEQLKQEALVLLRRTFLPAGMEALNETVLESPETDRLIADAETQPFMADRRLVIVRDYPALTGRAEADEKLITWLPSVPETTLLIFYCTGKPDGRRRTEAGRNGRKGRIEAERDGKRGTFERRRFGRGFESEETGRRTGYRNMRVGNSKETERDENKRDRRPDSPRSGHRRSVFVGDLEGRVRREVLADDYERRRRRRRIHIQGLRERAVRVSHEGWNSVRTSRKRRRRGREARRLRRRLRRGDRADSNERRRRRRGSCGRPRGRRRNRRSP